MMIASFARSSIGVLTNPAALLLIAGAFTAGYFRGEDAASKVCQTAALQSKILILEADRKSAESAAKRFETEARENRTLAERNAAIIKEISDAAKTPACRLSDADARRVFSIK